MYKVDKNAENLGAAEHARLVPSAFEAWLPHFARGCRCGNGKGHFSSE